MLQVSVPWWEFVLRGVVVYAFLFAALRLTGKRQVGQLAPFDLILLLILSNAVQNSMNAGDNSLVGGLISAATLIAINWLVAYITYKSPRAERWFEGESLTLVENGRIVVPTVADEHITERELMTALRLNGAFKLDDIRSATLETNGHVSVWLKDAAARR